MPAAGNAWCCFQRQFVENVSCHREHHLQEAVELELQWCERKILLPDWWLEAGAGVVRERNTVELEGWRPAEHGECVLANPMEVCIHR